MNTTNIDANKFSEMGHKFIAIHAQNGLASDNLDFSVTYVEEHPCGTVACHGGWGLVILKPVKNDDRPAKFYSTGSNAIAKYLGFDDGDDNAARHKFISWAHHNPLLWGNRYGLDGFGIKGYKAFGKNKGECTLEDIGNHYIEVGKRIIAKMMINHGH